MADEKGPDTTALFLYVILGLAFTCIALPYVLASLCSGKVGHDDAGDKTTVRKRRKSPVDDVDVEAGKVSQPIISLTKEVGGVTGE